MTSDIKLSHCFLLIEVKEKHVLDAQIIQKTISEHQPLCECRETSTIEPISLQTNFIESKCFEVLIAIRMDITTNIFLWISRFTAILS